MTPIDPIGMIRPRRKIEGISAILLPFLSQEEIDWTGFRNHVRRTADAGLTPAVNMDTGYVNLIDEATRLRVLRETKQVLGSHPFVAGAYVGDRPGDLWNRDETLRAIDTVQSQGGTPVLFQTFGLTSQDDEGILASYEKVGNACDRFIAFELGTMFAAFGRIYSLDVYESLLRIKSCIGAKHSSLDRIREWERLQVRDRVRPDFRVYTGNDLAIDMVMYGSDYLLGLSTFAPDLFAIRDRMWLQGDPAFYELNDTLQYLGHLTFRPLVPAYKHSAAQFLALRGWIESDRTHPGSPVRPDHDHEVLQGILDRLSRFAEVA